MIKPRELFEVLDDLTEMRDMGVMELNESMRGLYKLGRSLETVTLGELAAVFTQAREQVVKDWEGYR